MKISELICRLKAFQKKFGDLPVVVSDDGMSRSPCLSDEPRDTDMTDIEVDGKDELALEL